MEAFFLGDFMKTRRVAITGISALCGLGNDLESVWNGLLEGKSGISLIKHRDEATWPVYIAGNVNDFSLSEDIMNLKDQKRFDIFIHYALHCAEEAIAQAGLNQAGYSPQKIGCILGTGLGGFPMIEETTLTFHEKGPRRVSPFFIPSFIPNMSNNGRFC